MGVNVGGASTTCLVPTIFFKANSMMSVMMYVK